MFENCSRTAGISAADFIDKQEKVVATGDFWGNYKEEIHQLFAILGKESVWSEQPDNWLPLVKDRWMGKEHGFSEDKEQFSDEQIEGALQLLEAMGFVGELVPPPGRYEQAIVLGGTSTAFQKRIPWLLDHGIDAENIIILAGQRPVEARDGTRGELLSSEGRFGGRHDVSNDAWVQWAFSQNTEILFEESHMARLMLPKMLGKTTLQRVGWSGPPTEDGRYAQDYHFKVQSIIDGEEKEQNIVIMHGRAVPRESGDPRPTTASTTYEWLERLAPKGSEEDPVEVVVLSGNPHTLRTVEEIQRILRDLGRLDIKLIPAGTIQAKGTSIGTLQTALGELVRLVDRSPRQEIA